MSDGLPMLQDPSRDSSSQSSSAIVSKSLAFADSRLHGEQVSARSSTVKMLGKLGL